MASRGLKINASKTKLLTTEKKHDDLPESGKYPYAVCGSGVGVNSILCLTSHKWCHKCSSGVFGRVSDVISFV